MFVHVCATMALQELKTKRDSKKSKDFHQRKAVHEEKGHTTSCKNSHSQDVVLAEANPGAS